MKISEIDIYPIKSLKGISLESTLVEKRGLQHDRRWMLTDLSGMFFTQREVPKMATINVEVTSDGLRVTSADHGAMSIPGEPDRGLFQDVTVWQSDVAGVAYVGAVSEWFSDVLGRKCQLVLMPESAERRLDKLFDRGGDIVSFADGYPLLLIGEGSLDDLNERVADNAENEDASGTLAAPVPMNRFRPNLVVKGSEPFAEDKWSRIKVGESVFRVVKPCSRCVITTIDQERGEYDGKDPLRTLASYRMAKSVFPDDYEAYDQSPNAVLFGENLIPENPGATVNVGDKVDVLEYRRN